jgi:hypothetical protein
MNDTWTKKLWFCRGSVTYTTTGEVGTGFVHTAKYEGSVVAEVTHSSGARQLTRAEVEKLFKKKKKE